MAEMSNQEILERAIEKAIAGGFNETIATGWLIAFRQGVNDYYGLIFNHDFARAIWGDTHDSKGWMYQSQSVDIAAGTILQHQQRIDIAGPTYWYHLCRMVLADDPIAYLGANI